MKNIGVDISYIIIKQKFIFPKQFFRIHVKFNNNINNFFLTNNEIFIPNYMMHEKV